MSNPNKCPFAIWFPSWDKKIKKCVAGYNAQRRNNTGVVCYKKKAAKK